MSAYREHERFYTHAGGPSRTKQAFKDEVDINNILRKHEKGLLVDHVNKYQGRYGDFIVAGDFHDHMNLIQEAQTAFMTIPAEIRARFNNDPAEFLAYAQDPDNLEQMIEMGLAPKKIVKAVPDVTTAPEPITPEDLTGHIDEQPS